MIAIRDESSSGVAQCFITLSRQHAVGAIVVDMEGVADVDAAVHDNHSRKD